MTAPQQDAEAALPPAETTPTPPGRQRGRRTPQQRTAGPAMDVLEQLARLHPRLFGASFLPLKRGIFQDLLDRHPEVLQRDSLKQALALHTRSTRYLQALAGGGKRYDLDGQTVEAVAPEHHFHALLDVFRRRTRQAEDISEPRRRLVARIQQAIDASGLSLDDYAARVRGRDEEVNAALDEALSELRGRSARDEALLRAYKASGASDVAAFADMYGMAPSEAQASLQRAQRALIGSDG